MKHHYETLDGLRGFAAIAVMAMHEVGIFRPGIGPVIHASVAVDLFFMLSGFVLAYSYDQRLDMGFGWGAFMKARLIRLYPLLFLAIVLSFCVELLKFLHQGIQEPGQSLWLLPAALLLLPTGPFFGETTAFSGTAPLVSFGGPVWSLLFEFIASAAFASGLRKPKVWGLIVFPIGIISLCLITFRAGEIGVLGMQGYVGVPAGLLRVGVPFALGVYLQRRGLSNFFPVFSAGACVLAGVVFCILPIGKSAPYDLLCVLVVFPAIIGLCVRAQARGMVRHIFRILGDLSYPLYLLHVPVSRITGYAVKALLPHSNASLLLGTGVLMSLVASFGAFLIFDQPVRHLLSSKLFSRNAEQDFRVRTGVGS